MPNKPKKIGVFLARFQPIHNAHLYVIETALKECDHVAIMLGSSNKNNMPRNPFDFNLRYNLLMDSLKDNKYLVYCKEEIYECDKCVVSVGRIGSKWIEMVCKDLDIPRSNFNRYCRNEFQRIDANLISKLCAYLDCDVSDLIVYVKE